MNHDLWALCSHMCAFLCVLSCSVWFIYRNSLKSHVLCACICMLSYMCALMCVLLESLLYVLSCGCSYICVLMYACLSCVCALLFTHALICVLPLVCFLLLYTWACRSSYSSLLHFQRLLMREHCHPEVRRGTLPSGAGG